MTSSVTYVLPSFVDPKEWHITINGNDQIIQIDNFKVENGVHTFTLKLPDWHKPNEVFWINYIKYPEPRVYSSEPPLFDIDEDIR